MSRRRSPFSGLGLDRLNIFVPAVMSVGLMFWLVAFLRDVVRWRSDEALERRATNAGRSTARMLRSSSEPPDPDHIGLRHRPAYLLTALSLGAVAAYVFVGSLLNYRRPGGYVEGVGWLLATASIVALGLLTIGVAAFLSFSHWPTPPRWVQAMNARTPLSRLPLDRSTAGSEPSWQLSAAAMILPTVAIIGMFLLATDWEALIWVDEFATESLQATDALEPLTFLDPLGSTGVAIALAAIVGIATLRCRPLAIAYPLAVGIGLLITETTRNLVGRERPPGGDMAGMTDSFPSGHVVQAALIAGLLPLSLAALTGNRRVIWPSRIVLGIGVIVGALHRVDEELHWAADVFLGALVGLSIVVAVEWIIDHESWHRNCRGCLWAPESEGPPLTGVIHLDVSVQKLVRVAAHLLAAGAVLTITVLTLVVGVPTDPGEGAIFGPDVQRPVQLGLAAMASLGAVLAWRWDAVGAVLLAFAGTGLGLFAALEYPPWTAFGLTVMFLAPAVLLWLGWQHRRRVGEIVALAAVTVVLLGATWVGATVVHDFYFGPTHPESEATRLPAEQVEWVWVGALSAESVTVTARVEESAEAPTLVIEPARGGPEMAATGSPSGPAATRFEVENLDPGTEYRFRIEIDGESAGPRGIGRFQTPPVGPASFRFAVGSCARTDSNGAVFDAISAADPLFYLNLGDIHYGNIDSTDPAAHRAAYERMLTQPGQAALYRTIPTAYVWDDHDYGPNDSDASSPGREAVRQAYREVVPHYDLAGDDGGIYQAFTIGRVRFVLTDSRSMRAGQSMLGSEQKAWLLDELIEMSRNHALVVWGNPVPWISGPSPGGDGWNGFAGERREIADALARAGVDNLVMVSGDAHMVALDDGSNSDFSSAGDGGFPVFHAAALDRPGNAKGGPYSHGSYPGGGQFGIVEVVDDGDGISVTFSGRTWDDARLVEETFEFAGP